MTPSTVFPPRPSQRLDGKVAIVTGAGSLGDGLGNGRATSLLLAEAGATVLCVDLGLDEARRTAEMIVQEGGKADFICADVRSGDDCEAIVTAAKTNFGRLDILINNVGIMGAEGTAVDADVDEWFQGMTINVTSMVLMAKYAIPLMLKNEPGDGGIRGSIVNMASIAGLQGGSPHLLYPTSKGAVVNMTRAMAYQHGHQGIRVNCVCPGMLEANERKLFPFDMLLTLLLFRHPSWYPLTRESVQVLTLLFFHYRIPLYAHGCGRRYVRRDT